MAALGLTGIVWSGCSGNKATELVAGVSSQVQVPRDLQTVVVSVVAGRPVFQQAYPVYDGKVRLPRTLGIVAGADQSAPVTITVAGYTADSADDSYSAIAGIDPPHVGGGPNQTPGAGKPISQGGGARILRVSRQPYKQNHILFVPMPLRFACFDVDCEAQTNIPGCEGGDCTCKGGRCVPPDVDNAILPDYDDFLVFGNSNTCFRPLTSTAADGHQQVGCLDYAIPPQVIDEKNCIYALPGSPSVPNPLPAGAQPYDPLVPAQLIQAANSSEPPGQPAGTNLNVRVIFDNVVSEVLDYEGTCPTAGQGGGPVEGFCTFADAPQKFQLAPGLCPANNPLHKITLIESSAGCSPKTEYQPICQDNADEGAPPLPNLPDGGNSADGGCNVATQLTPAPSALYVLFDKSSGMRDFFGQQAFSTVLGLSLGDQVFKQTQLAFAYTPGPQTDCSAAPGQNSYSLFSSADGAIKFEPSAQAQSDIATSLLNVGADGGNLNLPAGNTPWYLEAALDGAYQALITQSKSGQNKEVFNKLAVMIFMDRDFNNDCGGQHAAAVAEAQQAYAAAGIETYVVMLNNADLVQSSQGVPPQSAIDHAAQLAQPQDQPGNPNPDATSTFYFNATGTDPNGVEAVQLQALTKVVADLGSCVYETTNYLGTGATLSFLDVAPETQGQSPVTVNVTYGVDSKGTPTACADDSDTTPRWVFDNQHIHICPHTCSRLVNSASLLQQSQIAQSIQNAAAGLPPPPQLDITVTGTEPCNPATPDPKVAEAGVSGPTINFDSGTSTDSGTAGDAADAVDASAD